MKLARWLPTAAATFLAGATLFAGPAAAAPATTTAPAATALTAAANAPTAPKYFLGTGYGPLNIATEAAWGSAYAQAEAEGYPAANCARSAGPAANPVGSGGYYQVLLELYCVPPPPPGSGQIVGVHSGKCLDVKGAKTADGTPIQIYSCNGTSAQAWKLEADGTLRALGKCMDVQYAKTENGSLIGLNSCHQGLNQKWEQLPNGLLRSVHSGKCLDALGWATGNGARVGIWDCTPQHTNQQWHGSALGT
ncbi:ricin-type beta-trefoil lectin domain protein [Streptomyces sp. NBC_00555]|uniref:RICIN domain-containing protein n=1 Tax=Streptomyces sp. NBC_00555 TaxID=2903662 RepID=UPI00224F9D2C|nr:RICIN domain-containing protein [Streptomyces sp. NBC_00555]MCX5009918.1 ricin-type beta-trefoil lectin domain protein [Streptomyces sp. NBC_00555]